MEVRNTTRKDIENRLDKSIYTIYSFNVSYSGKDKEIIKIIYEPNPKFFLSLNKKTASGVTVFEVTSSPTEYFNTPHTKTIESFVVFFYEIDSWIKRLSEELESISPLVNNKDQILEKLLKDFDQKVHEEGEDINSFFTGEEVKDLKEKLDLVYKMFEDLKADADLKDSELKLLKEELEKLKKALNVVPKKSWYNAAGKKIIEFVGKYVAGEAVKEIVGEATKKLLE